MNNDNDMDLVINALILGGTFVALFFFVMMNARSVEKGYEINGRVNEITFTEKGTPEIMIGGEIYTIRFPGNAFINKIQVGDSVAKEKDSESYRLIKKNSGEIIVSE